MSKFSDYGFGATSAIMTSLAIMIGLGSVPNSKTSIIIALFVIAIADNISDSFGIHIQQESQNMPPKEVSRITYKNFITRFFVCLLFVSLVYLLPIFVALILSAITGAIIIMMLSYLISKAQKVNPYKAIFQHLSVAIVVMIISYFLRLLITQIGLKIF